MKRKLKTHWNKLQKSEISSSMVDVRQEIRRLRAKYKARTDYRISRPKLSDVDDNHVLPDGI